MVKVAYCAGHGGKGSTAGKRTPVGEYEWNFNNVVASAFAEELSKYEGVSLMRTDDASGNSDVPLETRTNKANAWGADLYVSFHENANTGKWGTWTGTETYYWEGDSESKEVAKLLHDATVAAYGLRDRGIKKGNHLWIVKATNCIAILIEGGFMDSTIDIKKLRDEKVLKQAGINVAQAVAKYYGLKKEATKVPKQPDYIGHEYEEETKLVKEYGLMQGYPNGNMGLEDGLKRGHLVKVLANMIREGYIVKK